MSRPATPERQPIFVVGAGRSGTTLVQLMLDAHPHIAILGELHYFDQILQLKKEVPALDTPSRIDRFFELVKRVDNYRYLPEADELFRLAKRTMVREAMESYEDFFQVVLDEHAKTRGAARCGEKTPTNIRYLRSLVTIFPDARIIHVIRDPRDVVASCLQMPWTANDVIINALKWRADIHAGKRFSRDSSQYLEVRYEDLLQNPRRELESMCSFVREPYSERMLSFYQNAERRIKDEPWKTGAHKPLNASAVERWQRELTDSQVFLIQKVVGSIAWELGYQEANVTLRGKIGAPSAMMVEASKYLRYKKADRHLRSHQQPGVIFGEKKRLYENVVKSFIYRRS